MPHIRSRLLRTCILFGCLLLTPLTAGPGGSDPDRFLKVKAWILDFTIIETFSGSLAAYGASSTKTVQRSANGQARLVPDSPSFDKTGAVWRGVTSGSGKALDMAKSGGPVGSVTDTLRASGAGEAEAVLDLRTENGTYSLGAALGGTALESIEPGATPMLGWRKEFCPLCKGNVRLK